MHDHSFFDRILGLICSVFDAYSAVLFLHSSDSTYTLVSHFSLGDNIQNGTLIQTGQGLVGWVLRNNQPLLVDDFHREGGSLGYYPQEAESKIKAFMGCPLPDGRGALCLDSKKSYTFSPKQQKILHQFVHLVEALCAQFSQQEDSEQKQRFYAVVQTFHRLRHNNPRWSIFLENLLQTLAECTHFSYCLFASRDEMGHGYSLEGWSRPLFRRTDLHRKKFDINAGVIGWVFRNHKSITTADKGERIRGAPLFEKHYDAPKFQSVICVPLIVHMRTRGVLVLADEERRSIHSELMDFVALISDQLALFLENLYLKNKLRQLQEV
ncbi:GAF domain-containing protein [Desulfovermiculus halophilus]|jgi:signal transduction protein with GAF and PtsI domain|uniref:GAF domain-containing protein n=1 Tax=Desulfovermiculus halophilus TaxID=339722 RepID=UPI0004823096|nr:GAF domain-containing protein [Desulfovermiculus halophilus]